MRQFNERSGVEFDAYLETFDGAPTIPESVHWRVRNVTLESIPLDWQSATWSILTDDSGGISGVKVAVEVPGTVNVLSNGNKSEQFELQVVTNKDTAREFSEVVRYKVVSIGVR